MNMFQYLNFPENSAAIMVLKYRIRKWSIHQTTKFPKYSTDTKIPNPEYLINSKLQSNKHTIFDNGKSRSIFMVLDRQIPNILWIENSLSQIALISNHQSIKYDIL